MSQRARSQDLNFIRYINTYLNIFLITPWTAFDKKSTWKPILAKLYGTFLILCLGFRGCYLFQDDALISIFQEGLVSTKILNALTLMVLEIFVCLCVVRSAFFDNENWRLILENFCLVDKHLHGTLVEEKTVKFYGKRLIGHVTVVAMLGWAYSYIVNFPVLKSLILGPIIHY